MRAGPSRGDPKRGQHTDDEERDDADVCADGSQPGVHRGRDALGVGEPAAGQLRPRSDRSQRPAGAGD